MAGSILPVHRPTTPPPRATVSEWKCGNHHSNLSQFPAQVLAYRCQTLFTVLRWLPKLMVPICFQNPYWELYRCPRKIREIVLHIFLGVLSVILLLLSVLFLFLAPLSIFLLHLVPLYGLLFLLCLPLNKWPRSKGAVDEGGLLESGVEAIRAREDEK